MIAHSPRILVVDDNRDASDSLVELLFLKGFDAQVAYGGARALAIAARWRPDIIILDIGMPEVDGYLVVGALRDLLDSKAHIVALTALDDADARARIAAGGFDEHLVKPASYAAIMRVVSRSATPLAA